MKELLKKGFEAGKDKQWDIEWQMGRSKPDFEEWYREHESQALNIANVVHRRELLLAVICEYNKYNTQKDIKAVEDWLKEWDSK